MWFSYDITMFHPLGVMERKLVSSIILSWRGPRGRDAASELSVLASISVHTSVAHLSVGHKVSMTVYSDSALHTI